MLKSFIIADIPSDLTSLASSKMSHPDQFTTSLSLARTSEYRRNISDIGNVSTICAVGKIGSFPIPNGGEIAQEKQVCTPTSPQVPQCASSTPEPRPNPGSTDHTKIISTLPGSHREKVVNGGPALPTLTYKAYQQKRRPRQRSACVDNFIRKRWRDTTEIEKFSAAAAHTEAVGGFAFSLNLGIEREGMLLCADDPKTRMRKNLDKHLRAVGLEELPLAWLFEVTPIEVGNRLHLHGVVDTSKLSDADMVRLEAALMKAGGNATHAIGGDRQLDMKPIYYAAGWVDYLLKSTRLTSSQLRLDQDKLFSLNQSMTRRAKTTYEIARSAAKRKVA